MPKYRKKPVVVDAVQFTGTRENLKQILALSPNIHVYASQVLGIETLEGEMQANLSDWIIRGIAGEFYPCKNEIFQQTYSLVDDETNLFQWGCFDLHSGDTSNWKVDCDALTEEDLETLAKIITNNYYPFGNVVGIPRGGVRLAEVLRRYGLPGQRTLIVDDVLTTGQSMMETMDKSPGSIGVVIFARGPLPEGVHAIWNLGDFV